MKIVFASHPPPDRACSQPVLSRVTSWQKHKLHSPRIYPWENILIMFDEPLQRFETVDTVVIFPFGVRQAMTPTRYRSSRDSGKYGGFETRMKRLPQSYVHEEFCTEFLKIPAFAGMTNYF